MSALGAILNPKRKGNLKFILSKDYEQQDGTPLVWEMRQLSAKEMSQIRRMHDNEEDILDEMMVKSLVSPNFYSTTLLDAVAEKNNVGFLTPKEALKLTLTGAEIAQLLVCYMKLNSLDGFAMLVEEAKN